MHKNIRKPNKPAHKVKSLIDGQPRNTNKVKREVAIALNCSIDKVSRWYRDSYSTITEADQFQLVQFFALNNVGELYQPITNMRATRKPIAAHKS
jgi:hypothetical protein